MNRHEDHVSLNVFDEIQSLCRDYRKQLKKGNERQIEDYLNQVDETARPTLFQNLLFLDIQFRQQAGERVNSDDYTSRFPKFKRLIRQAFFEDTMMSMDPMQDTPADDSAHFANPNDQSFDSLAHQQAAYAPMEMPAARRIGEYELIRELGRGGMGVVYEAKHLQRQNRVALKTLPTGGQNRHALDNAERLHNFRREFRSLADMNHPNLIGMQSLEVDGGQWFFTMDLIDGEDLLSYVRPNQSLSEERLRGAMAQLVSGIMALHGEHIIHRDLKPNNVMVDGDGNVTILDFGLVTELNQQTDHTLSMKSVRFAGTPVYAAPEQVSGNTTMASDWYSMGVMLHEALTGNRPFKGTAIEVLDQKRFKDVPRLEGRNGIPDDLARLTDSLLQRRAEDRPGPLEIAKAFSIPSNSLDSVTVDHNFSEPLDKSVQVLVGRDKQLSKLNKLKARLLDQRKPLTVFVEGKSGEGKTSLAEKFLAPLRMQTDLLVLSGRCYDRESVPFKAIDSFIDSLVAHLRGRSNEKVIDVLPEDIRMLANLFPVLDRVQAIADLSGQQIAQLDGKQIRARAFNALGELLMGISQDLPMVIFVDDLQWGDADSAEVLFSMLASRKPPAILLLGSYRSDEADNSPFLQTWEKCSSNHEPMFVQPTIAVGPLSQQQCLDMMIQRFGDGEVVRNQATALHSATGGTPYFLDQLIESFNPDTGSFTPIPLNEVIANRLKKLPADAGPLLEAVAVAGSATSIQEACQAVSLSKSAFSTVTHMRTERLLRLIGSEDNQMIDTYHDKIRETVLGLLDDGQRRKLHSAFGQVIERSEGFDGQNVLQRMNDGETDIQPPARVFDLAFHYSNTDDPKALVYSILAAKQAVSQYALPLAINYYRAAERLMGQSSNRIKYEVHYRLGTVLQLSGQYEAANENLEQAVELAADVLEDVRARLQQADIVYKTGSLRESIDACSFILDKLGCPIPKTRLGKWISIKWFRLRLKTRSLGKPKPLSNRNRQKTALLIAALRQITYPGLFRDRDIALWAGSIADDLAQILDDKQARMLTTAMCMCNEGWFRYDFDGVNEYYTVCNSIANELNDRYGLALSSLMHSATLLNIGDFQTAKEQAKKAILQFDELGDVWRKIMSQVVLVWASSYMGDFATAQKIAKDVFPIVVKFGQNRMAMAFLMGWIRSTNRDFPLQKVLPTFERSDDDTSWSTGLQSEIADWYLKNDNPDQAMREALKGIKFARDFDPSQGLTSGVFAFYSQALREYAAKLENERGREQEIRKFRKLALRTAKDAVRFTRPATMNLPHALRELALNHLDAGRMQKAFRLIKESCDVADQIGAKYEHAQSLLVYGRTGAMLKMANAEEIIKDAESQLAEFATQLRETTIDSIGTQQHQPG